MNNIRISIIIPAYNEARHLRACLKAIADQTVAPSEVIIVDNNSTDQTAKIAQRYPFVTLIHEPRQGIVFARNAGFDAARGNIITRIDADTHLPRNWVERVRSFYQKPENHLRALTGSCEMYNLRSGRAIGYLYSGMAHTVNRLLIGYYCPWGSNSAIPKGCWLAVRNEVLIRTDIHEDLDLGIALAGRNFQTVYEPSLHVEVAAKRMIDGHGRLLGHLLMWPRTFRVRHIRTWPLAFGLAIGIWLGSYLLVASEKILARFSR